MCSSFNEYQFQVSLILAEPHFSASILPWHNLQFWYLKNQLPRAVLNNVRLIPQKAEFCMMAVQFENLWKIRAPVKNVEQFNLKPFDEIIQVRCSGINMRPHEHHSLKMCSSKVGKNRAKRGKT